MEPSPISGNSTALRNADGSYIIAFILEPIVEKVFSGRQGINRVTHILREVYLSASISFDSMRESAALWIAPTRALYTST